MLPLFSVPVPRSVVPFISVSPNNVVPSSAVPNLLPTTVTRTASNRLARVGVSEVIPVTGVVSLADT